MYRFYEDFFRYFKTDVENNIIKTMFNNLIIGIAYNRRKFTWLNISIFATKVIKDAPGYINYVAMSYLRFCKREL